MHHKTIRAALLFGLCLALGGCKVELYSHLSEQESVQMEAVLLEHGIDVNRIMSKDGTFEIEVDKDRLASAVELLKANMLPRQKFATMADVFTSDGLVSSPVTERARFIYALSQELSQTIMEFDGVLSARVHVVLPHNDPLRQDSVPAAASVFIRYDSALSAAGILPQIKMLVANSIEGLSYDKVSVVLLPVTRSASPLPLEPSTLRAPAESLLQANGLTIGIGAALLVIAGGGGGTFWYLRRRKQLTDGMDTPKAALRGVLT